jgi:hypothetical protein
VYPNSAVHVLLVRAIAELALLELVQTSGGTNRTAWEAALAVRELLKFDFFFAGRDEFADELWNEVAIIAGGRLETTTEVDATNAARWLHNTRLLVAHLALRPFIDAYRVLAAELVGLDPDRSVDEKQALRPVSASSETVIAATPNRQQGIHIGREKGRRMGHVGWDGYGVTTTLPKAAPEPSRSNACLASSRAKIESICGRIPLASHSADNDRSSALVPTVDP